MFTRKILECIQKEESDVVALYKFYNEKLELNYSFDRFIDEYYILKEQFPDVFEEYCIIRVNLEDNPEKFNTTNY